MLIIILTTFLVLISQFVRKMNYQRSDSKRDYGSHKNISR